MRKENTERGDKSQNHGITDRDRRDARRLSEYLGLRLTPAPARHTEQIHQIPIDPVTPIEHSPVRETPVLPSKKEEISLHPVILSGRAVLMPENALHYLSQSNGEARFNLQTPEHKAALAYTEWAYEEFKIKSDKRLDPLKKEFGVETIAEVREHMLQSSGLYKNKKGQFYVPYDHHAPQIGEGSQFNGDFFNWDNLFSIMWARKKGDIDFIMGILANDRYLFDRVGHLPNSATVKLLGRGQCPVDALKHMQAEAALAEANISEEKRAEYRAELDKNLASLKDRYFSNWSNDLEGAAKYNPHYDPERDLGFLKAHTIEGTILSHYGDADLGMNHDAAQCESGEDYNLRAPDGEFAFYAHTDLNGLLGTFEKLFMDKSTGEEQEYWKRRWELRKKEVNDFLWDDKEGWYMDRKYTNEKREFYQGMKSNRPALAAMLLVEAGMVPEDRFERMATKLETEFMQPYGLAVTPDTDEAALPPGVQWNGPIVWAPREYFAKKGLRESNNPRHHLIAEEAMIRSTVARDVFHSQYYTLQEKHSGQKGGLSAKALYKVENTHKGFMWAIQQLVEDNDHIAMFNRERGSDHPEQVVYDSQQPLSQWA